MPKVSAVDDLFATAAQALFMAPATQLRTSGRAVVISNQVQPSLDLTRRQAAVAVAVVLTCEALLITRAPAAVVRTLGRAGAT